MLQVRLEEAWVPVPVDGVVRMILDGEVERATPAQDATVADGEGALERFLKLPHFDELAGQILQRIRSLYHAGEWGTDPDQLLLRLRDLCSWGWSDQLVRGRLLWLTAWLEEIAGSSEKAVTYYSMYLAGEYSGTVLKILAYNNRGAIRVRMGETGGVFDLARVAFSTDPDVGSLDAGLPAACFNLLNLLNAAGQSDTLEVDVNDELRRYMLNVPKEVREHWLGPDGTSKPVTREKEREVMLNVRRHRKRRFRLFRSRRSRYTSASASSSSSGSMNLMSMFDNDGMSHALPAEMNIVGDHRRLNRLCSALAKQAKHIAPPTVIADLDSCPQVELNLWSGRRTDDVAGMGDTTGAAGRYAAYAEAASLLYAREIPSSLSGHDNGPEWPKRLVEENLARAESYLEQHAYELAESAVNGARQLVESRFVDDSEQAEKLMENIERVAERVDQRHRDHESLQIHQACVDFQDRVLSFCNLDDYRVAKKKATELQYHVSRLTPRILDHPDWGDEALSLIEDHVRRADGHLESLEKVDRSSRVQQPRQRLYKMWPQEWEQPVSAVAFETLAQCQAIDPSGQVDDWDLIRSKLHQHQAQYYFQFVMRQLEKGQVNRQELHQQLELAVKHDPELKAPAKRIEELLEHKDEGDVLPSLEEMKNRLAQLRLAAQQPKEPKPKPRTEARNVDERQGNE